MQESDYKFFNDSNLHKNLMNNELLKNNNLHEKE
jgi:hypothetical protein